MRTNTDKIERASKAKLIRSELQERIFAQREIVIEGALREYRGGTLTTERLWGIVGELSALAGIIRDVEREITQGQQALGEEVNG